MMYVPLDVGLKALLVTGRVDWSRFNVVNVDGNGDKSGKSRGLFPRTARTLCEEALSVEELVKDTG